MSTAFAVQNAGLRVRSLGQLFGKTPTGPRLAATRRGTGCARASAIAASLAAGADLEDACRRGREHVRALLEEVQSQGASGERNGELAVHG